MKLRIRRLFLISISLFLSLALLLPGCRPAPSPEKGNPKLDSLLNGLVRAEKRGEAESVARQNNVELIEGRIRVIIECVPGQVEIAAKAATDTGATLEGGSYKNLLQALVPITSLTVLADENSIRYIRIPITSTPASN